MSNEFSASRLIAPCTILKITPQNDASNDASKTSNDASKPHATTFLTRPHFRQKTFATPAKKFVKNICVKKRQIFRDNVYLQSIFQAYTKLPKLTAIILSQYSNDVGEGDCPSVSPAFLLKSSALH